MKEKKNIYGLTKENQGVTWGEHILTTKSYSTANIAYKNHAFESFEQEITYRVSIMRRQKLYTQ